MLNTRRQASLTEKKKTSLEERRNRNLTEKRQSMNGELGNFSSWFEKGVVRTTAVGVCSLAREMSKIPTFRSEVRIQDFLSEARTREEGKSR